MKLSYQPPRTTMLPFSTSTPLLVGTTKTTTEIKDQTSGKSSDGPDIGGDAGANVTSDAKRNNL